MKQFSDRLEITNPGGFIGGITPSNVLHHQSVPRNPLLVNALVKMRLANRGNLGISRMYEAFLIEGKDPPYVSEVGDGVSITFFRRDFSPKFRAYIEGASLQNQPLDVDQLIVLHHLLRFSEASIASLARLCQRDESRMCEILFKMEGYGRLESCSYDHSHWRLPTQLYEELLQIRASEEEFRTKWQAAKGRLYSILKERSKVSDCGISNNEARQLTGYNSQQVTRLLGQLQDEHREIVCEGRGRTARYRFLMH